ncbi:DUF4238 domain-containing protein [Vibrio coralliilyticus]|uniref:DUF4238 domain-containing protein n=1 Tax=Vibrio coralliilyticus TaxID=190893 RepID=UPI001560CB4E|nr:DUF4238 domain-containing protein [Vibrio coralliilyticus]NRF28641.1 DUF4238 domain-containing protein [Vibrio coralliilyticus]NRF51548.1 DUF4238 domain-containing protein [Vibrio coralliilyticus]
MSQVIKRDNHFVPCMYLKNWATDGKVEVYRTLIQHEKVPLWRSSHLKGIGYTRNLYVDTRTGTENDELEDFFGQIYEDPAEAVFGKVIANAKLTPKDYRVLISFFALQDLRTPKKFIDHLKSSRNEDFSKMFQGVVDRVLEKAPPHFEPSGEMKFHDGFPLKLRITKEDGQLCVDAERLIGRASWLWSIKHVLANIAERLCENKWTILHPAKGYKWYTSDNPVLKLNYYDDDSYDFKGGWVNKGSELMLPLSPEHLLYTSVGTSPPILRGTRVSEAQTTQLNQLIVENSHRYVIADTKCPKIEELHTRVVSAERIRSERELIDDLHQSQADAEVKFYATQSA